MEKKFTQGPWRLEIRPFDLDQAKAGHPLSTRDGRPAKFIAHVPEAEKLHKVVALIIPSNELLHWSEKGTRFEFETETDLLLAPLGYCEGKPVFGGDKLLSHFGREYCVELGVHDQDYFNLSTWPSQKPIVETRMKWSDFHKHYWEEVAQHQSPSWSSDACENLANAAIARSIADGDVIPTEVVKDLMCKAYNEHYSDRNKSFAQKVEEVISEYLKGNK